MLPPKGTLPVKIFHTIREDVESLYYVVLYCALIWTINYIPRREIRSVLRQMFDSYDDGRSYPQGGHIKAHDFEKRSITGGLTWPSAALNKWFSSLVRFLCPDGQEQPDHVQALDVSALNKFWESILDDEQIPKADRYDVLEDCRRVLMEPDHNAPQANLALKNNGHQPTQPGLKRRRSTIKVNPSSAPTKEAEEHERKKYQRLLLSEGQDVRVEVNCVASGSESDEQGTIVASYTTGPPETVSSGLRTD